MARLPYEEDQSIASMNTRQLRQFISDQAVEAQKRVDSAKDTSKAFNEMKDTITDRSGTHVKRSTSYMSKAEMRDYAYNLRKFNKFDAESGYAGKTEWQENKKRYESFIRNQVSKSGKENQYWAKYILPSGNISKKGYQEYKDFITLLKSSKDFMESFNYRNVQQYAQERRNNLDPENKILSKTMAKVYAESKGQGWDQRQIMEKLKSEYDEALNKETKKQKPKTKKAPAVKRAKKTRSKSNIKVKTGKKMKSGTVRERIT